jgi:hypothetical protein
MKDTGPLPVTLSSFSASLSKDQVVNLNWSTSMEINCSRFVVQRSFDGIYFTDIATVDGNGSTSLFHSYAATDLAYSFINSVVYYRLKQIDFDGKANFSDIIAIKIKNENKNVVISPNPFKNFINVNFQSDKRKPLSIKIFSVDGKEMKSKQTFVNPGNNYLRIDGLSSIPPGNYLLLLFSENKKIVEKITKN